MNPKLVTKIVYRTRPGESRIPSRPSPWLLAGAAFLVFLAYALPPMVGDALRVETELMRVGR